MDRSTDSGPAAGSSATATMTKSKTFHGSRKNHGPNAYSRAASSATKIASARWSIAPS